MTHASVLLVANGSDFRTSLIFALEAELFEVAVMDFDQADQMAWAAPWADCLLVDHRLIGRDGVAVLEALRSAGNSTPAIVMASAVSQVLARRIAAAGAQWIEKPIYNDALVTAIRQIARPERE